MNDISEIKHYWDEQAVKFGSGANATTQDIVMRDIEINYIVDFLTSFNRPLKVLDIGCGNGYSTFQYQKRAAIHSFTGGDYSEEMISSANGEMKKHSEINNLEFKVMDVLRLSEYNETYDVIISDRCLVNLGSSKNRKKALDEIAKCVKSGGYYLMIENFIEGHTEFNLLRERLGLEEIKVRWHNSFFSRPELNDSTKHTFEIVRTDNISSLYYLITRVVYSKLCEMENRTPDYDNPIYNVAAQLPSIGNFGPICANVLRRR
jgi:ubiquinone/menaquinone biosynthesis C-methylase UbiE